MSIIRSIFYQCKPFQVLNILSFNQFCKFYNFFLFSKLTFESINLKHSTQRETQINLCPSHILRPVTHLPKVQCFFSVSVVFFLIICMSGRRQKMQMQWLLYSTKITPERLCSFIRALLRTFLKGHANHNFQYTMLVNSLRSRGIDSGCIGNKPQS